MTVSSNGHKLASNNGRNGHANGTAPGWDWQRLESILRHYWEFRELYEREGVDEINIEGVVVNIHDLLRGVNELPRRQKEAIWLMTIKDLREADAAAVMGVRTKWQGPVSSYKRLGLKRLVEQFWSVDVPA